MVDKVSKEAVALSKFISPELQDRAQTSLQQLVNAAHANSADKGFWEKDEAIIQFLKESGHPDWAEHFINNMVLAKIALMHSELSEIVEGVRDGNPPSNKLHEHGLTQAEEEGADVFVRLGDLFGRMGWNLPRAIILKMGYNTGREKLHGRKL